jgi:acetolactate synthase small subunit
VNAKHCAAIVQVCDVSLDTMTVELQGKAPKMAAFQKLLQVLDCNLQAPQRSIFVLVAQHV